MRFLQHAGLNEATARALTDQSGDGHSPMPIFERYAQLKGYDLSQPGDQKKFTDWLNAMPPDQLGQVRDRIHRELDAFDGDAQKFGLTAAPHQASRADMGNPWSLRPRSVEQLDKLLAHLQLNPLPAP
jgi:hypothetical protein